MISPNRSYIPAYGDCATHKLALGFPRKLWLDNMLTDYLQCRVSNPTNRLTPLL